MTLRDAYILPIFALLGLSLGCASQPTHGTMTAMSVASDQEWEACEHDVPDEVCVRCHPEREASYKERGDWCPEHDIPESQCLKCNPDLDFSPPEEPPEGSDVVEIVTAGETVEELEAHLVEGKWTVFDFRADWCPPCRKVDEHLYAILSHREDIAVRKLNVVNWESPIAEQFLREVPELPFVLIYSPEGEKVVEISGAQLDQIDHALEGK